MERVSQGGKLFKVGNFVDIDAALPAGFRACCSREGNVTDAQSSSSTDGITVAEALAKSLWKSMAMRPAASLDGEDI